MNYPFDIYEYYRLGVQAPETDAALFKTMYHSLTGKELFTLGEDFCGTFAISCEWVKLNPNHKSVSVDLSVEPLDYGKKHYLAALSSDQQNRIQAINSNVLNPELPKAECIVAMNFSYFIFKTRDELRAYFENCYRRLPESGIFICDCFGGTEAIQSMEEETEVAEAESFSVFWDQEWFDPINNFSQFYLHFQPKGDKKYERVFSYDWRMWSIPEIREIMLEAGFKKTTVHWEETDEEDGRGNGKYTQIESTKEECDSWIALIAAQKSVDVNKID